MKRFILMMALCVGIEAFSWPDFELTVLKTDVANSAFAVGDIDGDGQADIMAASGGMSYLYWKRFPDWEEFVIEDTLGRYSGEIQAADVDNDGDIDLLSPDDLSKKVYWWENPLDSRDPASGPWIRHEIGTWGSGTDYPHDFKAGDVNADGKVDCLVNCNYGDMVDMDFYLYVQNSPASWIEVAVGPLRSIEGSWIGDVNLDGRPDLVDGMDWFETPLDPVNGTWVRHRICDYPDGRMRTNVGDLNGDGRPDVAAVVSEYGTGPFCWYEAPEDLENGTWIEHELVPAADLNYHTLQFGDMDNNGTLDMVVGSTHGPNEPVVHGPKVMRIFFNDGEGNFTDSTWITAFGVWNAIIGDVGSDGDLDILNCDYGEGSPTQEEFWENRLDPVSVSNYFGSRYFHIGREGLKFTGMTVLVNGRRAVYPATGAMFFPIPY
jgi:hypothetical protein